MTRREQRKSGLEKEREQLYSQAKRERTHFFLEHDPIKQYIRQYGWLEIIQDYTNRRNAAGVNRPLTYFTFPGPGATDVGLLWREEILIRTDSGFPDLVICDEKHADEALQRLGEVKGVSRKSFIQAIDDLAPHFPIDVVNLDIYGNVITGSRVRKKALKTLDAIEKIVNLQRGQCFLLLLTCSTNDQSARDYLEECFKGNLDEERFQEAYSAKYKVLDTSPFDGDYRAFVGLVLPKAIGRIAKDHGYQIVEHFSARYNRRYNRKRYRILCLSFEFIPLGGRKSENKYKARFKHVEWDVLNEELSSNIQKLSIEAYNDFIPTLPSRELIDVQDILQKNPKLEKELKQDAESLVGWEKRAIS